ncbi:SGNH/GDSL hydrolase family protein [Agaricicola taiwanensis]|uniref:SGNH/GDSL hydrolase family protein n=1 Tax=Agaricicola taiwanensis TaxID=591372 RepID=UPI00166D61B4|nr:DUF459 domain-containing protein [Agaricicola taiwanensis]
MADKRWSITGFGAMAVAALLLALTVLEPAPAAAQRIRQAEPGEVIYTRPPVRGRQLPPQVQAPPQRQGFRIPFLDRLFGGGNREVQVPQRVPASAGRTGVAPRAAAPAQPPKPKVEPKYFVAVVGDDYATAAADGLEEALEDRPDIAIVRKIAPGRGIAAGDPALAASLRTLLGGGEKINAVVLAIGRQDQRPIEDGNAEVAFRSARWNQLFATRIDEALIALTERRLPVVWLGLPPVADEKESAGNAHINELLRQRLIGFGASFHDVWDGFIDENEMFATTGPALDGSKVRLRLQDGVGFTRAGARKFAHNAELHIRRLFPADTPGEAVANSPDMEDVSIHILTSAPRTPGATLLDANLPAIARGTEGAHSPAPLGRADDFRWQAD